MGKNDIVSNDYISRDDFNALCNELATAKGNRGLENTKPEEVMAGQVVTKSHIASLQNFVRQTIRYREATSYPFENISNVERPLIKLYNEVKQVITDLDTNQRCVNCSNVCREICSVGCYSTCGSGCSDSCVGGCDNDNCTENCGHGCTNLCYLNSCISGCKSGNCIGNCYSTCANSCSSACKGGCSGNCNTSCMSTVSIDITINIWHFTHELE
jgi:hypothetical protein